MRQQTGTGAAAVDGATWQWSLGESLTATAGHARADNFADHKPAGDIFQLLRHIRAKRTQGPAAIGAGSARRQDLGLSLEMIGQWRAAVFPFARLVRLRLAAGPIRFFLMGGGSLRDLGIFLQVESQLVEAFGFRPEPRLAMACNLSLQVLTFRVRALISSPISATRPFNSSGPSGSDLSVQACPEYIGPVLRTECRTCQLPCIIGLSGLQWPPRLLRHAPVDASSSIDSCDGLRDTFPSLAAGQTKRLRSSRLENRHPHCVRQCLSDPWRSIGRATCATDTPGASVCSQIDRFSSSDQNRFSSSDQNRFFWPFLPAMECLKMSTIYGGHYQSRIPTIRAVTTDGYVLGRVDGLPEVAD
jgi:hypothetical protein